MKELSSLKELESTSKMLRMIVITISLSTLLLICFGFYKSSKTVEQIRKSIYVPSRGESMELLVSKNYKDNRVAEIRNHLTIFHELFYTLLPDEKYIKNRIENRALYLGDKSLKEEYEKLTESKYYNKLVAADANQGITIDSVAIDYNVYPYKAAVFATLKIIRRSNITERSLITACQLINSAARSERNPHGFTIEQFEVITNQDIKVYERK
jgi:conjugative transposon TraK protein